MASVVMTGARAIGSFARTRLGSTILRAGAQIAANTLFAPNFQQEGPRLAEAKLTTATEGKPIPKAWGTVTVAGNVIWATKLLETRTESESSPGGGKGTGGGRVTTTEYSYSRSFALSLCEGEIAGINRIWVDGEPFDTSKHTVRLYKGTTDQAPDSLIESVEGSGNTPAYRGLAYLVFDNLDLTQFGNRIPQFKVEVIRPLEDSNSVNNLVKAVTLIPASGEFAYSNQIYFKRVGMYDTAAENMHNSEGLANAVVALDQLETTFPNCDTVLLVCSWFGTDLRAGQCEIKPKVEFDDEKVLIDSGTTSKNVYLKSGDRVEVTNTGASSTNITITKVVESTDQSGLITTTETVVATHTGVAASGSVSYTSSDAAGYRIDSVSQLVSINTIGGNSHYPQDWSVAGLERSNAELVSRDSDNRPYFGGTPSDNTVVEMIQELKARGFRVVFYPFILMDVPPGNGLPDPYGGSEQGSFPWRGRITVASGNDKTAAAATEVNDFFGNQTTSDFAVSGTTVKYSGADSWTYRRMALHYMNLCKAAGGVDGFLVGTEMVELNRIRSDATNYPAITKWTALLSDARSVLGASCKLSYAADWSEYHSHRPTDSSGDMFFHLDPVWADTNCDFIGIDNYLPISDWREGSTHLDAQSYDSIYDLDYLKANIEDGEYADWHYASSADRDSQTRTNITDGSGEPWVFANKKIKDWWLNDHHDRPAGVRSATTTSWAPESKPIWFTEFGCPAIDKATNQPNVFYDPKSSESAAPYYSDATRDDLIQRQYLTAMLSYWQDASNNPLSSVTSERMVDVESMFAWTWDARPYPAFPYRTDVWSDGANYNYGHWLNGRYNSVTLAALVKSICGLVGIFPNVSDLIINDELVIGYAIEQVMSPRAMLGMLEQIYGFDGFETGGEIVFKKRGSASVMTIDVGDYVVTDRGSAPEISLSRGQESEIPQEVTVSYYDSSSEYEIATITERKQTGQSQSKNVVEAPIVLSEGYANAACKRLLYQAWAEREQAEFILPQSYLKLDPGDVVQADLNGQTLLLRIAEITDAQDRRLKLTRHEPSIYDLNVDTNEEGISNSTQTYGQAIGFFLDLPLIEVDQNEFQPRFAAFQNPWPGSVALHKETGTGTDSYNLLHTTAQASQIGELVSDLHSGPSQVWDRANEIIVQLYSGTLQSRDRLDVLNGANAIAVENIAGDWEIIQFQTAELLDTLKYRLSNLLRGRLGTELAMRDPVSPGARVVALNTAAQQQVGLAQAHLKQDINYRYGPSTEPVGSDSFTALTENFDGVGLRPYAVAHVEASKNHATNDITFNWIRRSRAGAGGWDVTDTPLHEANEAYEIDIMNGSSVVRTLNATTNSKIYTSAEQIADFGSHQSSYSVRIYQLGEVYGRGSVAADSISV